MKNSIIYLTLAVLSLSSCEGNQNNSQSSQPESSPKEHSALQTTECDPTTPQTIDLKTAGDLIYEFMKSSKGQNSNVKLGIGSYISIEQLQSNGLNEKMKDANAGVLIYDMVNSFNQGQFALQFGEVCKANDRTNYSIKPDQNYFVTNALLKYNTSNPDAAEIVNYIKTQGIRSSIAYNQFDPLDGVKVSEYNNNLISRLGGESSFSSRGCYFFNINDFERVLTYNPSERIIGFAICRGIEKISENGQDKSYDRLILIGVNSNLEFVHGDKQILERSWPPRGF